MAFSANFSSLVLFSFFLASSLVGWLAYTSICPAFVFVAVGIAWPNHLAVFAMCISVLKVVTTELVSLRGGIGTDIGCTGCRWAKTTSSM